MGRKKTEAGVESSSGKKVVARNKIARVRYDIEKVVEVGVALVGTEVKSLRAGTANLRDAYADIKNGEVFLENCHIAPYAFGNISNHSPLRPRKLLLHKKEIRKLVGKVAERGYTLIPLEIYFVRGKAKVALGLGKGKRFFDRREEIRRRDIDRETERERRRYR